MESRQETPLVISPAQLTQQIQTHIKKTQKHANTLVEFMTDGFKNRFHVDLEAIVKLQFDYNETTINDVRQFIEVVGEYLLQIENISEGCIDEDDRSSDPAFEKIIIEEAATLKGQLIFSEMKLCLEQMQTMIEPWFEQKIAKASYEQRLRDMQPVEALQEKLTKLKEETEKRVINDGADRLRLLEVNHLCEQVDAIIGRIMHTSPKQLLTDCCREVELSIENIKNSTYGTYSKTVPQLEEILKSARESAIKNADAETEMEVGSMEDMLNTIRYLLSPKFDAFWVSRNSPRGVTEMRTLLLAQPENSDALWQKIKDKASERLNAKTLLGYPIPRTEEGAIFYFHIIKSNLNALQALKTQFEETLRPKSPTPT